jgi:hypothetical protein
VKYTDPDGIIFDITANGWAGAAKDGIDSSAAKKLDRPDLKADRSALKLDKVA